MNSQNSPTGFISIRIPPSEPDVDIFANDDDALDKAIAEHKQGQIDSLMQSVQSILDDSEITDDQITKRPSEFDMILILNISTETQEKITRALTEIGIDSQSSESLRKQTNTLA